MDEGPVESGGKKQERGGERKESSLDAGGAQDPEKQEIRGREPGNGSWDTRGNGDTERVGGSEPAREERRKNQDRGREGGQEAGKAMKTFFHLLPGGKGRTVIGGMTESLIGAVGLKEFVFGTSFLSVSSKDQDSSEASPSSSLSVSPCLRLTLLAQLPPSPGAAHVPFFLLLSISVCAFPPAPETLAISLCPPGTSGWLTAGQALLRRSRGPWGPEGLGQGLG